MKLLLILLGLLLITSTASADVSGKVISYEKEIRNGKPIVKVTTEYTYPDDTKKTGYTRYNYDNFNILAGITFKYP